MFSLLKMSLVPQSYIINYALDLNQDKYRIWPWAVTVLQWPFSLCVRTRAHIQYSHIVIWKHHCPVLAFYFTRRMSVLLHSRHMEITSATDSKLKGMDLRWSFTETGASVPSFLCRFLCFYNINAEMKNVCKGLTWSRDNADILSKCYSFSM